jgi:hypothetical protein
VSGFERTLFVVAVAVGLSGVIDALAAALAGMIA